jgi:hypothetical protein
MNVEVKRLCITSFGMVGIYSSFDTKKLLFKMNANKKKDIILQMALNHSKIVVMFLACCGLLKVLCHDLFD